MLPNFFALFALLYAAFGVQSPFLPALLQERGLFAGQIGVVLAASTAIRVIAGPAIGHAADRTRRHALVLCACAVVAAIVSAGYLAMRHFAALFVVSVLYAAMLAPLVPLSDALATTAAYLSERGGGRRFAYGWLRACGSAAFVAGTTASGWFTGITELAAIIWVGGLFLAMAGAVASRLPALTELRSRAPRPRGLRDWGELLRLRIFRRMLLVAALVEGSHALHDTFSVIRWRAAGIDFHIVGLLWSESVLSEVLVFLVLGPALLRRFGPAGACAISAGAGAVRWTVAAFTTSPLLLAVIQPLHGLTFALLHLACMRLIVLTVPRQLAGTAQAVYGTLCIGAATALLTLASGWLYGSIGGTAFLAMAALCLLAMPACATLRPRDTAA
ncbi:MAG TPA: MFS transporter [Acetobacteraceae bacterium]|nr:MFS transporter [Acetobacteraceae bacterium]